MIKDKDNVTLEDVLQPGTNMLAAGYCMYGSSCTVIESSKPVFPQHNLLLSVPIWNWLAQLICGSLFWALGVVSMASHLTHHLASSYWLIQTSRLIWVTDCGSIIFCLMVQATQYWWPCYSSFTLCRYLRRERFIQSMKGMPKIGMRLLRSMYCSCARSATLLKTAQPFLMKQSSS